MTGADQRAVLTALLDRYGQTYAEQAGIKLADRPSPLYQGLGNFTSSISRSAFFRRSAAKNSESLITCPSCAPIAWIAASRDNSFS